LSSREVSAGCVAAVRARSGAGDEIVFLYLKQCSTYFQIIMKIFFKKIARREGDR